MADSAHLFLEGTVSEDMDTRTLLGINIPPQNPALARTSQHCFQSHEREVIFVENAYFKNNQNGCFGKVDEVEPN